MRRHAQSATTDESGYTQHRDRGLGTEPAAALCSDCAQSTIASLLQAAVASWWWCDEGLAHAGCGAHQACHPQMHPLLTTLGVDVERSSLPLCARRMCTYTVCLIQASICVQYALKLMI